MRMRCFMFAAIVILWNLQAITPACAAATLTVGPDKAFGTIAAAVRAAHPGDIIKVWPLAGDQPYRGVHILMRTPRITIVAATPGRYVAINGGGFNYNGRGPIPRAIFQFDPTSSGCTLEGFELYNAHNDSFNGAGVRINAADNITIRRCYIHNNDMGIMSNGIYARRTGAHQLITGCHITRNGTSRQPGYNHNLYLGGTSAVVRGCDISHSLTGHNLKSRCHMTWVEYCYIHDSANRELDLVDARGDTDVPHSDAVILGCIIQKSPHCPGNHQVIHFGRDGHAGHDGTLYIVQSTIETPYPTAAVLLSTRNVNVKFINDKIRTTAHRAVLVAAIHGADAQSISGKGNDISPAYNPQAGFLNSPPLPWSQITLPWARAGLRPRPLMQYRGAGKLVKRLKEGSGAGRPPTR